MDQKTLGEKYYVHKTYQGGMGVVHICTEANAKSNESKKIALKTHLADMAPYQREYFYREAEAWAKLGRPGEERCFLGLERIEEMDGRLYLVMPYCEGGTLQDRLINGPLNYEEAIRIATPILLALYEIDDEHGMLHRDLKPTNILFDGEGRVKVSDLGIVRFLEKSVSTQSSLTQPGTFVGTWQYAAPEQAARESNLDCRIDIWAFGVVMLEMLSGKHPFFVDGEPSDKSIRRVFSGDPIGLDEIREKVPKKIIHIIKKCLEKDREDRFGNFKEILIAWKDLIQVSGEFEKKSLLKNKDDRVYCEGPQVESWWKCLFPELFFTGNEATASISEKPLADYRRIIQLRTVHRYKEAHVLSKELLGSLGDPDSLINRVLKRRYKYEPMAKVSDKPLRYILQLPPSEVTNLIAHHLSLLVDILETKDEYNSESYISEIVQYSEKVLASDVSDEKMRRIAIQGLIKGRQFLRASELAMKMLNEKADPSLAMVLVIASYHSGNKDLFDNVSKTLIEFFDGYEDSDSMWLVARIKHIHGDNEAAIRIAQKAFDKYPGHGGILTTLVTSLLHLGDEQAAASYFPKLQELCPYEATTQKIGKHLGFL